MIDEGYHPICNSYGPPMYKNDPVTFHQSVAPDLHISTRLEAYQPKTDVMKKAKEYWSSYDVYEQNKEEIEKIKDNYPHEVEQFRQKIWKWCRLDLAEQFLSKYYEFGIENEIPTDIPEDFVDLESYKKVESWDSKPRRVREVTPLSRLMSKFPSDADHNGEPLIEQILREFPDVSTRIRIAKKYILGEANETEKELIRDNPKYKAKAERFRVLLWERHLEWNACREHNRIENERALGKAQQERDESIKSNLTKIFAVVIAVGFFFSSFGRLRPKFSILQTILSIAFSRSKASLAAPKDFIIHSLLIKGTNHIPSLADTYSKAIQNAFCACGGGTIHCGWNSGRVTVVNAKL